MEKWISAKSVSELWRVGVRRGRGDLLSGSSRQHFGLSVLLKIWIICEILLGHGGAIKFVDATQSGEIDEVLLLVYGIGGIMTGRRRS